MKPVDFKAKAHIFRNTAFMLKCSFKSAPVATILIYLAYISENVYYAVVFNVMFLQTALSIIEGNGTYREFVIKIGLIILGKLAVDLFGYVVFHPIRERQEIKLEGYINRLIFEKAQQVELGCYENPDFFDNYNRATWVIEKGAYKRIIEGSAWTIGSVISIISLAVYLYQIDPILLIIIVCPVIVMYFRVKRNGVEFQKEKEMTPFERQKDRKSVV